MLCYAMSDYTRVSALCKILLRYCYMGIFEGTKVVSSHSPLLGRGLGRGNICAKHRKKLTYLLTNLLTKLPSPVTPDLVCSCHPPPREGMFFCAKHRKEPFTTHYSPFTPVGTLTLIPPYKDGLLRSQSCLLPRNDVFKTLPISNVKSGFALAMTPLKYDQYPM